MSKGNQRSIWLNEHKTLLINARSEETDWHRCTDRAESLQGGRKSSRIEVIKPEKQYRSLSFYNPENSPDLWFPLNPEWKISKNTKTFHNFASVKNSQNFKDVGRTKSEKLFAFRNINYKSQLPRNVDEENQKKKRWKTVWGEVKEINEIFEGN